MAPSRAYVPSRALLRALSRPQPPRCPFARPRITPFNRGKRTQAAKPEKESAPTMTPKEFERAATQMLSKAEATFSEKEWEKELMKPRTYDEIEKDDVPIRWYEQDLDKGTPRRLISRSDMIEDRKREIDLHNMIVESETNPDYDDAELNRRLIDSVLENPNFAALTQQLKEIKKGIKSKEELAFEEQEVVKQAEQESKNMASVLKEGTQEALRELMNDPAAAVAKAELQEVLDNFPEMEEIDNPEFLSILNKAMGKLNDDPTFQKKMAAMPQEELEDMENEVEDHERRIAEELNEPESPARKLNDPIDLDEVDDLVLQMRDVLKSMGGDDRLEAEMDALLAEDPRADQEGVFEREMTAEELAAEFTMLAAQKAPKEGQDEEVEEVEEEELPAELQAKVDQIMQDPKLMQKLVYIQNLIEETERAKSDITSIAHEVAPDPYELEEDRTATLKQRMQAVRKDPEHVAALDRLRVDLPRPFSISPSLKSFNQAIELAYIGANDDIRRVLWRSYQKARTLPTFLQNVNDEAWDILYYSQAVTWGSNQNRMDHLRLLLKDLKSLGRDGPPTHPSSLILN